MKRVRTMSVIALSWLGTAAQADDLGWKTADVPPVAPAVKITAPPAVAPVVKPPADLPWKSVEATLVPAAAPVVPVAKTIVLELIPTPALPPEPIFRTVTTPPTQVGLEPLPSKVPVPTKQEPFFRTVAQPAIVQGGLEPLPPQVPTPTKLEPLPPMNQAGLEPLAPSVPALVKVAAPLPMAPPEPTTPPATLPPLAREPLPKSSVGPRITGEPRYPAELAVPMPELPKLPPAESLPAPRAVPREPSVNPNPICNDTPDCPPVSNVQRVSAVTPGEFGIPVRRGVFGSAPVNLSHDYFFRDFFGLDLLKDEPPPATAGGANGTPEDSFFVQAEYLLWWANKPNIPVLATTNSLGQPGFLGQPGTQNLLGPGKFGPEFRDGFRIRTGGWLDECSLLGFDASFFFLGRKSESASFDSGQFPVITRPFFAPNFNSEFGEIVAQPNLATGRLDVTTDSFLWGADINFRKGICRTCDRTTGWFAGYRHLNLTERLTIAETLTASGPLSPDPIGTKIFVQDRFETRNQFHGGQVGGFWYRKFDRFDWDLRAGIALGVTQQTVEIDGLQQRTRPGQATENFRGGLLATGPNLGSFTQNKFSVVPEITTSLGYRVLPNLRLYAGYNFLSWSNVIRPGDQIDRVVDVALVPNPPAGVPATANPRPLPTFRQSDFWAQGVQFGVEFRW